MWYCFLTRPQLGWNANVNYVRSEELFLSSTEEQRAAPASCGHQVHPLWKHVTVSEVFLFIQEMLIKHRKKLLISLSKPLQNHRSFRKVTIYNYLHFTALTCMTPSCLTHRDASSKSCRSPKKINLEICVVSSFSSGNSQMVYTKRRWLKK